MLRHIEPQAPLLGGAHVDILQTGTALIAVALSFDPVLSGSDGTGEECATTNDNDAIDADMHVRAGDTELILRVTQRQSAVMMVFCYSGAAATAGAAGAADSSTPVGASSPSLLWSSASGSITCASGSLFPRLCLVETDLPSPEGVLLLREARAAPPHSDR